MTLLRIEGLTKSFGGLTAIDGLDLQLAAGEIVSVIGPNGAGKTTLFNLITGVYRADAGSIAFDGVELVGRDPDAITRFGISRTFQNVRLFPDMTVLENVMVGQHCRTKSGVLGAVLGLPRARREQAEVREKAKEILSFFGTRLSGYRHNQPAFVLSYANRRRLEIARAMATDARVLLLDEPVAGMNPRETAEMIELVGRLRDERGFTLLVIEHDMKVVRGISDRVVALDYGRRIAAGSYEEVASDERVIEAYLGKRATA
jgi:branched-chain amino acid transport system ATP-binding protein